MRLPFGWELRRVEKAASQLFPVDNRAGWWPLVREPFTGAWQRNEEVRVDTAMSFSAVYACISLIAADIGKMGLELLERTDEGRDIWVPVTSPAFSPVLRKPNRYQTRIKFFESWVLSKLTNGNAYILKQRDDRQVVTSLYVLDPLRTKPLVAPDGSVWYQLSRDHLAGVEEDNLIIPASEIIHDVMSAVYHPLCGVSPIQAAALAISGGVNIQRQSSAFFRNGSKPGGLLLAPGEISEADVERVRSMWEHKFSGDNFGRIAVLGSGLQYETVAITAHDAQLIEQLKLSAETVCSCFHVPAYMVGIGELPTFDNIEALNQHYYQQCLQTLIESIELSLDEGLGLTEVSGRTLGVGFNQDDLLRMDSPAKTKAWGDLRRAGIATPNEARAQFDLPPLTGGDDVYMQEQEFGLAAHARRNALDDPFAKDSSASAAPKPTAASQGEERAALARAIFEKCLTGLPNVRLTYH